MRALLVDDHPEQRQSTRALLESAGYRVLEAARGPQALTLTETHDVDLLVTAVSLPGMDGLALADRLSERLYDRGLPLAVVLMSNDGGDPALRKRVLDGGVAFLRMPSTASELTEAIDSAFARKHQLWNLTAERWLARKARSVPATSPAAEPAPTAGSDLGEDTAATRPGPKPAWGLAAAAGLALAVVGVLRFFDHGPPPLPPPPSATNLRSAVIEGLQPAGPVDTLPSVLEWQDVPNSRSYRIEVRSVDDAVLWSGQSESPVMQMPAELAAGLQPAVTYIWTVEALDASGARLAWSPAIPFQVRPAARDDG